MAKNDCFSLSYVCGFSRSAFNVLKYRSIGTLSYGHPGLLMLWMMLFSLYYSMKSLEVNWLPRSECRIMPVSPPTLSSPFYRVKIASCVLIFLPQPLETTRLSYRSMIVQL